MGERWKVPRLKKWLPHPSVHTVKYGHFWQGALLVWIVPHWALVQRVMARSAVCTSPTHHRGAPRLGVGTTSLCHVHHLVGPYHPLAWFFLSLFCRWYSTVSVSRSCRFALYNIRKIRPYLTQYATQLLVQTLVSSRLDYCRCYLLWKAALCILTHTKGGIFLCAI